MKPDIQKAEWTCDIQFSEQCPCPEGSCVGCKHWVQIHTEARLCEDCIRENCMIQHLRAGRGCLSLIPPLVIPPPPAIPVKPKPIATDSCFNCLHYCDWGLCNEGHTPRTRWRGILRCRCWEGKPKPVLKEVEPIQHLTLNPTHERVLDKIEQIIDGVNDLKENMEKLK